MNGMDMPPSHSKSINPCSAICNQLHPLCVQFSEGSLMT